jgi:hypothetical protein
MSHLINPLSKIFKKSGQSTVEFVFVIPFLITFILAVVEFSLMFVQTQRVSALSRETVNASFRDCSTLPKDQLDSCVDSLVKTIGKTAATLLFDFNDTANGRGKIIISIYQWENGEAKLSSQKQSGGGGAVTDGFISQFSPNKIDGSILENQESITIGEVFYQYKPLTIVGSLLDMVMPENLYEVTIY